jgi:hypothetical protein
MRSTGDNSYEEPAVAMIGAVAGATQHNLLRAGQLGLGGADRRWGGGGGAPGAGAATTSIGGRAVYVVGA